MATPADKVAQYIRIREFERAAKAEFDKSMKRTRDAKALLEAQLLQHLNDTGGNKLSCDVGTVYRRTITSVKVVDQSLFRAFGIENDEWDAFDIRANKTYINKVIDENGELPPGVKVTRIDTVGVWGESE